MEQDTITVKIELRINISDKAQRTEQKIKLCKIRDKCVKGANAVMSHLYYGLMRSSFIYQVKQDAAFEEGLDIKDKEVKKKITTAANEEYAAGFVMNPNTGKPISSLNATYRLLSSFYLGDVPAGVLAALNSQAVASFNELKSKYLRHERSLSTFRSTMPIPVPSQLISNVRKERITYYSNNKKTKQKDGSWLTVPETVEKSANTIAFTLFNIPFQIFFGRGDERKWPLIEAALSEWFLPSWIHEGGEFFNTAILESKTDKFQLQYMDKKVERSLIFTKITHEKVLKNGQIEKSEHWLVTTPGNNKENRHTSFMMQECKRDGQKAWQIVSDYKLSDSSITIEKRASDDVYANKYYNKIFFNAVIRKPRIKEELYQDRMCTCRLDPESPVIIEYNNKEYPIGNYEGIIFKGIGQQQAYRRRQRANGTHGGKGRIRKMWTLNNLHNNEKNFRRTKAQQLSFAIIKFCLENKIKHIHLTGVIDAFKGIEEKRAKFLIRNWGWSGLYLLIENKATSSGMIVTRDKDKVATEETE